MSPPFRPAGIYSALWIPLDFSGRTERAALLAGKRIDLPTIATFPVRASMAAMKHSGGEFDNHRQRIAGVARPLRSRGGGNRRAGYSFASRCGRPSLSTSMPTGPRFLDFVGSGAEFRSDTCRPHGFLPTPATAGLHSPPSTARALPRHVRRSPRASWARSAVPRSCPR